MNLSKLQALSEAANYLAHWHYLWSEIEEFVPDDQHEEGELLAKHSREIIKEINDNHMS